MIVDREQLAAERDRMRAEYLLPADVRPESTGRGVHHYAMISSNVERTVQFWQDIIGYPLVDMFENRDLAGSTHFFFDAGHGNLVAYFDLPGVEVETYKEVRGGHHHLALSMSPHEWLSARERLQAAGITYHLESEVSLYFLGPDGERLELIADPLGEMYGHRIL